MAKLRAYPKGSTEAIEWTLAATEEEDVEKLASSLLGRRKEGSVTFRSANGLVQIEVTAYAALEVIK